MSFNSQINNSTLMNKTIVALFLGILYVNKGQMAKR